MGYLRPALAAATIAGALLAAPALADQRVVAAAVDRYVNPDVTITAGDTLIFASQDPLQKHTLTAFKDGADGKPLFTTPLIGSGQETPVVGTAALPAGTYEFFCTIHPTQMRGLLTVTATAQSDTVAPQVLAHFGTASLRTVLRRGHIFATVSVTEASTSAISVRAHGVTIATATPALRAGTSRVQLNLTPKGLKALKGHGSVRLTLAVRAADGAGNQTRVTARETLRR